MEKEGDTENYYLYVGEQYNANTGLYYLRVRYMNPSTGTFTTMDSYQGNIYEPASLHKYMYANANPVMNIDPSGYFSMPSLCVGMTVTQILEASISYISISMLVGGFMGALFGGVDAALGGGGFKEILKEALMGFGTGLVLGAVLSTLMCFSVIYPILLVIVQVFQVVLVTLGMVGAIVSCLEGNIAQAVFRALLSVFSFLMIGKQIKGFELMRMESAGVGKQSVNDNLISKVHGNSKQSTKLQHGYEIYEIKTGDVVKTGISGQKLNQNGSSPRANTQVNSLNKVARYKKYDARIVKINIEGRAAALEWEVQNALRLWEEGNSMNIHSRPQPWKN